jgi:hypothetical protein
MWHTRRHLAPPDQAAVLHEAAADLLAEEGQSVPDWETVGPQIADEIDRQSEELLADARADYDAFERLRTRAAHAYRGVNRFVGVLATVIAGYLFLFFAGPEFLPVAAANPGLGLTVPILSVLAVVLIVGGAVWRWRRRALMRSVSVAYRRWTGVLRDQVLRPFIVEKRNEEVRNPRLLETDVSERSRPRLIEGSEPRRLVVTEAMGRVSAVAQNVHSGSLGVTGPRGVGKTTILQFFGAGAAADDGRDLLLVVSAPVDYVPREFIIHLFKQLCEAVPHRWRNRSALARDTRRHLDDLRYLRTYTTSLSASLPRPFLNLALGRARLRAEQPITLPELVDTFRGYSERVAAWQRSVRGDGARVVIAIDEVDKIRDSDRAEAFLNDIKAIFDVPGCLYLVSLSEDAMVGFARRTPSIRGTFDSAFDELVPVGPMTYRQSEQLLFKRVTGVPRPFIALCHVLAGGLPRDLVRAIRALIDALPPQGDRSLADVSADLIRRELESLRQSTVRQLAENDGTDGLLATLHDPKWAGTTQHEFTEAALQLSDAARDADPDSVRQLRDELIVSLSFYATVLAVFSAAPDRLITCLKEEDYAIVDALAAIRYAMRMNAGLAHRLLEQYRRENEIGKADGIS